MFDEYIERGKQIQAAHRKAVAEAQNDRNLSAEGKAQRIAALERKRRESVEALQAEAQAAIAKGKRVAELELKLLGEKALEERRKLLGDMIVADMLRREIEVLDAAGIAAMYQAAPTEWERSVISGYGLPILRVRYATSPTGEAHAAMNLLQQAEPEPVRKVRTELFTLDQAKRRLGELDREAYNTRMADAYGVRSELME